MAYISGWKPASQEVEDFLNEIESLSKKYNLSIAHEDSQGGFRINKFSKENIEWLRDAFVEF